MHCLHSTPPYVCHSAPVSPRRKLYVLNFKLTHYQILDLFGADKPARALVIFSQTRSVTQ
jgi:hypothetical protein